MTAIKLIADSWTLRICSVVRCSANYGPDDRCGIESPNSGVMDQEHHLLVQVLETELLDQTWKYWCLAKRRQCFIP